MRNGQARRVVGFHWFLELKLYDGERSVKNLG